MPIASARWNDGYCFTSCSRCGRDMVRSAFGEWHVPKGFRVVWRPRPPGNLDAALNKRYGALPASPADAGVDLRPAEPVAAALVEKAEVKPLPADSVAARPAPLPPKQKLEKAPAAPAPEPPAPEQTPARMARSPFDFDDFKSPRAPIPLSASSGQEIDRKRTS
jgi:hypothetical protein